MPSEITATRISYFSDLSSYTYFPEYARPQTLNVGWLENGKEFEKVTPSNEDLDFLWEFCKISVAQTRGGTAAISA